MLWIKQENDMADYCQQCSIELFGGDYLDLSTIFTTGETALRDVICEGCGKTVVDITGKCVGRCQKNHIGDRQAEWEE
jgi:hypothetical protein